MIITDENRKYSGNIAGIPTQIVDSHNEVYPFWAKSHKRKRRTLIHIDNHADMEGIAHANTWETLEEYSHNLEIDDFIIPSIHYGFINEIYWINPREDFIIFYEQKNLITKESGDIIDWQRKINQKIPIHEFQNHLSKRKEIILDIDLDAFLDRHDRDRYLNLLGNETDFIDRRIQIMQEIIKNVQKPDLITIATSAYDVPFTPREHVGYILREVQKSVEEIYSNRVQPKNLNQLVQDEKSNESPSPKQWWF